MLKKISHFLTDIPAWFVLVVLFFAVLWLYYVSGDQFLQRLLDAILGGIMGVLMGKRIASNPATTNIENVENVEQVDGGAGQKPDD